MAEDDRGTVWVVNTTGQECGHPPGAVQYLGDDGSNGYFHCQSCGAVLISRIGGPATDARPTERRPSD